MKPASALSLNRADISFALALALGLETIIKPNVGESGDLDLNMQTYALAEEFRFYNLGFFLPSSLMCVEQLNLHALRGHSVH